MSRTIAESLKAATTGMRKRDVIDVREAPKPKAEKLKPTAELMAKIGFERVVGTGAYRRVPLFETLHKRCDFIGQTELAALRFYREAHDSSAVSPTRCALNDEGRGGGVPICIPFAISGMRVEDLQYGTRLAMIERQLGNLADTMRAVVLDDKSFSVVAIERFGGRKQSWIEQEESRGTDRKGNKLAFVDKIAPKSGRHRQIIADEFRAGMALLVEVHAPYVSTGCRSARKPAGPAVTEDEAALMAMVAGETAAPIPAVDRDYLDERGLMLPYADIAALIRAKSFGADQLAA